MPGREYKKILDMAADQFGYVTTSQVREQSGSGDALRKMAWRGSLERVHRGLYRVPTFPWSPFAEYMEATLWPAGLQGVVSHQSSLALRGLSDVSPSAIHITVPKDFRIRRRVPHHLIVHNEDLPDHEVTRFEGIPTTTLRRTIEDCHRTHLGPDLLRQAIVDAQREGFLSPGEAEELIVYIRPAVLPGSDDE